MKKDDKDIRKQLLESFDDSSVPEIKGKIKAEYIERQEAKKKKKNRWLKGAVPALSAALLVAIITPITIHALKQNSNPPTPGPGSSGSSGGGNSSGGGSSSQNTDPDTAKFQAMTYGVVGGSNYLQGQSGSLSVKPLFKAPAPVSVLEGKIDKINPYMLTAEEMMDGSFTFDASTQVTYTEGAEYPYSMVLEGGSFSWKEEALPNHEDDEEEYKIEGEYLLDGRTYYAEGKREKSLESTENELETELWIEITEGEYLCIAYQTETEHDEMETGFTYGTYSRMWDDDTASFEVEVNYEEEGRTKETTIKVTTVGEESEFKLHEKVNNQFDIDYEFEEELSDTEYEGRITAIISADGSTYTYKQGNDQIGGSYPRI